MATEIEMLQLETAVTESEKLEIKAVGPEIIILGGGGTRDYNIRWRWDQRL